MILKFYENHGQTKRYYHEKVGYNSRLDSIQAKILNLKLDRIEHQIKKRIDISTIFFKYLIIMSL